MSPDYDLSQLLDIWFGLYEWFSGFLAFSKVDMIQGVEKFINENFDWLPGFKVVDIPYTFTIGQLWDEHVLPWAVALMIVALVVRCVENIIDILP